MRTTPSPPDPTAEHDDYMNVKDAAKDLDCGERWLRDGANHHGFPHHRLGKSLQFSRQDRAQIRAMCRVPAQPAKLAAAQRDARKTVQNRHRPAA